MRPFTFEQEVTRTVAQALLERLDSDDEEEEREEGDIDEDDVVPEPQVLGKSRRGICIAWPRSLTYRVVDDGAGGSPPNIRKRALAQDDAQLRRHWFPWYDKISCTLDVLMHLPRSVFSQRQLDLFLWLLRVNDVEDVPSVRHQLRLNTALQRACGVDSIAYKGVLGHTYYVNALHQIIGQEMANPRVRPHLSFYPEDTGGQLLEEARQAARWLDEVADEFLTPMIRVGSKDFYVHEPLMGDDGVVRMPMRWFTRSEHGQSVLYARCWDMLAINTDSGAAWRVVESKTHEISAAHLLKNFPELCETAERVYGLPDPRNILEVVDPKGGTSRPWLHTSPNDGNPWRGRAKGHRVLAFPLWMYCDDTSGNMSKKWNEHNSVLVTAAGLPREQLQKEFNIHFLTTSNIAPPLEMMDGVIEQLRASQKDGIWAWDCVLNEPVLILPSVLALLGDNPMQSEFACHIGLQAKLFCRNCWCKGRDVLSDPDDDGRPAEDAGSVASDDSAQSAIAKKKGRAKRALESMADMVTRVRSFLKPGVPRNKDETARQLRSYFALASTPGTKTTIRNKRTETGIKDTLQLAHLETLFKSYKNKNGRSAKQEALAEAIARLPEQTTNPIWRIRELDAHQDTPVEVLHVVLLGFVKYFWRDLVQGQLKNKATAKELLITRLSSLDVSGLGISPLSGKTLVQYAGSLTGRDFRAIAQVAPFVIHDMVSQDCYDAWVALSRLVPLIYQPRIENVSEHLELLKKEIDHFLLCTARWTVRWFNKPKFHIIVHLVEHIRRFGPAGLFATESFESFNAVIRAKSVHSNRQAPSRDIARAFAQSNRIRHLLSGGYFMYNTSINPTTTEDGTAGNNNDEMTSREAFSFDRNRWRTVGNGPLSLIGEHSTVTEYLGFESTSSEEAKPLAQLATGKRLPGLLERHSARRFRTCQEAILFNGDPCHPGDVVIVKSMHPGRTFVARVDELLTPVGSVLELSRRADAALLRIAQATRPAGRYGMPYLDLQAEWCLVSVRDLLCTVNVQHACAIHRCGATGTTEERQERMLTGATKPTIVHQGPADEDRIINIAQMRDAFYLRPYRPTAEELQVDDIVTRAVAREVDGQKTARATENDMAASQVARVERPSSRAHSMDGTTGAAA
ncbi:hypothetical protein C8Q77DRAFT_1068295 [Trametes polyzona]|nr:hypothetical protein C8Q77DRAFT_1068295 [Trametes polyzona]